MNKDLSDKFVVTIKITTVSFSLTFIRRESDYNGTENVIF